MKRILPAIFGLLILTGLNVKAQNGKYGATADDSVACIENLSVYKDFLREGDYNKAKSFWRKAYQICPKSSLKMYVDGEKILKKLIAENKDNKERKLEIADTLMMLYDVRIQHFGKEGYVLGKKGTSLYKYKKDYKAAYETIKKSIELEGNKTSAAVIVYYFQAAVKLNKTEPFTPEVWVEMFNQCVAIIDFNIANQTGKKAKSYQDALDNIVKLADPYLKCDVLEGFFTTKYEEKKDNATWLESASEILDQKECSDSKIFFTISNQLHNLHPSAVSAKNMGIMSMNKSDYAGASKFFVQAIDLADDATDDANLDNTLAELELMLAKAYFGQKNYSAARTHAKKAISYKENWGEPYMLIGDMYAGSVSMCKEDPDGVLKTPYWVAVDMYAKAKAVDASVASQASQKIAKYSQYFPTTQDAFFYGVTDGSDYTVKCWINATTKARLK